jgi:hypothetical protein
MKLSQFVLTVREDGVCSSLGGLVEWDPQWRSRDLFAGYEPAEGGKLRKLTRAERLASLVCETNIEFILGKPGGGKSMYSTKMVVDELLHSHRPIVTNLALNLVQLQEYLFTLGRFDICVSDRVRILEHEEVFRFYLIRGRELELTMPEAADGLIDFKPSQEHPEAAGGVFYVIDEAHNYFPTKAKIDEDSPMFKWASQHRKLKDYCYFVTQSVENVHVKVRRLGQLYNYIRNLRKETFRGFRRGDGFQRLGFLSIPTGKRDEDFAIVNEKFSLDVKGLASCYFTAGGVGVSGAGVADGGFKKKGFHYKWLYVIAAAAVVGLVSLFFIVPMLGAKAGEKVIKDAVGVDDQAPASAPGVVAAAREAVRGVTGLPAVPVAPVASPVVQASGNASESPLHVQGVVYRRGAVNVILSDGRTLIESDPELEKIDRNGAVVSGRKLYMSRPIYREPPPPPADTPLPSRRRDIEEEPEPAEEDPEPAEVATTGRIGEPMRPGTFAPSLRSSSSSEGRQKAKELARTGRPVASRPGVMSVEEFQRQAGR